MRFQHRLPATTGKGLAGAHIDRTRPISFTLNDRFIPGFAGDTVLSALLASGVDTVGTHEGSPLGLRAGSAPAIKPVFAVAGDRALPMDRTPATDGAQYHTLTSGRRPGLLARLFQPGKTLGLDLGEGSSVLPRPWRSDPAERLEPTDLVVIGGGVAGMSAALAGAQGGLKVTLIEASPHLGGHSGLFGTQDGEATPEENVADLSARIADNDDISVCTLSEAFSIGEGLVRLHRIEALEGRIESRVIDLPTRFIVVATGAFERLPVFPGNRLPGVIGALEAYELARRYGIWQGESWLLATSSNAPYRLATLLAESQVKLERILEARDQASSRFIEFCKAYGIRQFPGTVPVSATPRSGALAVDIGNGQPISADRLVVCGGWQPDLTLWHMAGGQSRWDERRARLEPLGTIPGLALAGSAAGYFTRRACIASGREAVARLLGRKTKGIEDPVIDPLYETPDAFVAQALPSGDNLHPAYVDAGETLLSPPAPPRPHWSDRFRPKVAQEVQLLSEAPQPLSIAAICAGVGLGLIPPASAGVIAQERVARVPIGGAVVDASIAQKVDQVPAYLGHRFGPRPGLVALNHDPAWRIESGALIFSDFDETSAVKAIGVVLRRGDNGTEALVSAPFAIQGRTVIVRILGQAVPAEIEPLTVRT